MLKSQVPFKFYKRSRKSKLPVYYARYLQPDGTYTAGELLVNPPVRRLRSLRGSIYSPGRWLTFTA